MKGTMKRKFLLMALCGLLSACADSIPPASKEEQDAARDKVVVCLHNAAQTYDDNRSPADSIALGLVSICSTEYAQYRETFMRGQSLYYQNLLTRKIQDSNVDLKLATSVVLDERAQPTNKQSDNQSSVVTPLEKALVAENSGDYSTALKLLHPLAEQGNPYAQAIMGGMYEDGEGVPMNYVEATKWLRKAANQGEANAQFLLGSNYEIGQGVPQDYVLAYEWIALATAPTTLHPMSDSKSISGAIKIRDQLAMLMTPEQIAEAQNLRGSGCPNDRSSG